MKKTILILVLLFFGLCVSAQIPKGTRMIGTRLNYSQSNGESKNTYMTNTNSTGSYKSNSFNGILNGGYFVSNNIAIGLIAGYGIQSSKSSSNSWDAITQYKNENSSNSKNYSVGIYSRFYKMMKENQIGFFANVDAYYTFAESKNTRDYSDGLIFSTSSSTSDSKVYTLSLAPGVVYFITKSIGLEASFGNLSLRSQSSESKSDNGAITTDKSSGLNFNFTATTFNLGINFYF